MRDDLVNFIQQGDLDVVSHNDEFQGKTHCFGLASITDPHAITQYILGTGSYKFPKPHGVHAWFKATLG